MLRHLLLAAALVSPAAVARDKSDKKPEPVAAPAGGADSDVEPVTDPSVNSPKEAVRKMLFDGALDKPACKPVKVDPRGGVGAIDKDLDQLIRDLIAAIKKRKETELQPLFHRRLNVPIPAITESFAKLDLLLGAPFDVSIYRLWTFNTVDGTPAGLPCADDGLTAYPQYGYPLQFGLWLQLLGKRELGRIYVSIVPADGRWNIGAFHTQQWTHASKDFLAWTEEGQADSRKGRKEAAYVKLDIAQKLLDGGGFLEMAAQPDIVKARDAMMTKEDWDQAVRKPLDGFDIIYTASLLVLDGAGILARARVPGEISVMEIKESCKKMATNVRATPWGAALGGMRCSFNLKHEDGKREGVMGGIYLSFAELK